MESRRVHGAAESRKTSTRGIDNISSREVNQNTVKATKAGG